MVKLTIKKPRAFYEKKPSPADDLPLIPRMDINIFQLAMQDRFPSILSVFHRVSRDSRRTRSRMLVGGVWWPPSRRTGPGYGRPKWKVTAGHQVADDHRISQGKMDQSFFLANIFKYFKLG